MEIIFAGVFGQICHIMTNSQQRVHTTSMENCTFFIKKL